MPPPTFMSWVDQALQQPGGPKVGRLPGTMAVYGAAGDHLRGSTQVTELRDGVDGNAHRMSR